MLDKKYFNEVREDLLKYTGKRREVIKMAGDAQVFAKKAIFAMQRDDIKGGEECLGKAEELLLQINKIYKIDDRILGEGSYRAALEEFVESSCFKNFIKGEEVGKIKNLDVSPELFVSGLADVPGELLRYAIFSATDRKFDKVNACYETAEAIIEEMVDMDLTGYNRQKFDQAKQALQKLEQVRYEISLRAN